jgi:hypothetical protein
MQPKAIDTMMVRSHVRGMISRGYRRILALALILTAAANADDIHIFTDNKTALMWQDAPENKGVIHTWGEAKEYCSELDYGGFDDWWLPSEAELFTIVDTSRPPGRRIKKGFVYYKPAPYWTSSTYAWNAPHAWLIDFGSGTSHTLEKEQRRFARCVRCSDFKRCIELYYEK